MLACKFPDQMLLITNEFKQNKQLVRFISMIKNLLILISKLFIYVC